MLLESLKIPVAAQCTSEFDCCILMEEFSYHSKIALVTAHEKGIKYKQFSIDLNNKGQFAPWITNINPNNTVPMMLVGQDNDVVLESIDIAHFIDSKF